MFEQLYKQRVELTKIIEHSTGRDGTYNTDIPSLFFSRYSNDTGPHYGVYKPSLCIVVQGMKEVFLSQERFQYSPVDYLVASVNLPITAQVIEALPKFLIWLSNLNSHRVKYWRCYVNSKWELTRRKMLNEVCMSAK